ncbi:hypothetical protein [Xenococcus sp. PCC 7305]|uniref:hypothetical protein n=1 Tax=Xenococcus sp. PCC 7305 TaxID=102125 RepID=UPI001181A6DA|nr:hypothetical protein [Xenococcus sp. PCC 7305]
MQYNHTIEKVIRKINRELAPEFEDKLRCHLECQDKAWLIDQIIRLTIDEHSRQECDRKLFQKIKQQKRAERLARLRELQLDESKLDIFISQYEQYDRDRLEEEGYLIHPPLKGKDLITTEYRSQKGEVLLTQAKDILFAILFGDESTCVQFERVEQELLTLTLPHFKARTIDFMKATTEIGGLGFWQDPDNVSNDDEVENILFQVEYGEVATEKIGDGIVTALNLINNLEVNEQILYARIINVEQSTLVDINESHLRRRRF